MVWLDSKRENIPAFLVALGKKKLLATILQFANQDGLSPLGTPDEMIDNEMDSVLISLVFKLALFCRFPGRDYTANLTEGQQRDNESKG